MSKNQIREAVRRKADLRGLQRDDNVPPSLIERHKGTITGGAVYHNPKFKMAVVPPAYFDRKVGSGIMDGIKASFSRSRNPTLQRTKRLSDLLDAANAKRMTGGMDKTPSPPRGRKDDAPPAVERPKRGRPRKGESKREEDEEVEFRGKGMHSYRGGAKQAQKLGRMYMKQMMELDPEMKQLVGSGLFDKFVKGLSEFAKGAAYPVKAISKGLDLVPFLPNPLKPIANVLKDVDDPMIAKDLGVALKTRGRGRPKKMMGSGSVLQETLQVANPNVLGAGMNTKEYVDVPLQQISRQVRGGVSMTIRDVKKAIPTPSTRGSGKSKRSSPWIDFVKQYARENNMKYSDALKEASKHYNK